MDLALCKINIIMMCIACKTTMIHTLQTYKTNILVAVVTGIGFVETMGGSVDAIVVISVVVVSDV